MRSLAWSATRIVRLALYAFLATGGLIGVHTLHASLAVSIASMLLTIATASAALCYGLDIQNRFLARSGPNDDAFTRSLSLPVHIVAYLLVPVALFVLVPSFVQGITHDLLTTVAATFAAALPLYLGRQLPFAAVDANNERTRKAETFRRTYRWIVGGLVIALWIVFAAFSPLEHETSDTLISHVNRLLGFTLIALGTFFVPSRFLR